MTRTAADVTPEEMEVYRATLQRREAAMPQCTSQETLSLLACTGSRAARTRLLSAFIRADVHLIARWAADAHRAAVHAPRAPETADAYLDAASLSLNRMYGATKGIFRLIAGTLEQSHIAGGCESDHLLRQMSIPIAGVRPEEVIGHRVRVQLDAVRLLRDVINEQPGDLDRRECARIAATIAELGEAVQSELTAFADWLDSARQG